MSDVNDDMDELFKRAGENYPLNTDSSDWNEVYKALNTVKAPSPYPADKKKSRRFLWLLLLLLPLGFVVNKYIFNPAHQPSAKVTVPAKNNPGQIAQEVFKKENLKRIAPKEGSLNNNKILSSAKNILTDASIKQTLNKAANNDKPVTKFKQRTLTIAPENNTADYKTVTDNNAVANITDNADAGALKMRSKKATAKNANTNDAAISQSTSVSKEPDEDRNGTAFKTESADPTINLSKDKQENNIIPDSLKPAVSKAGKAKIRQQHFYAGIITGPDKSAIKSQKRIKMGYTGGILAGYKLSKKWSIETGFYLDKKYYYTEGKYFNTAKIPISYNTKIINADGYCNMIELPLNVKYEMLSTKKASWFVLAGSSSYLMKRENYTYRLDNAGWLSEKNYSYKNSSKNWASIINLSVGYNRNVGKNVKFRIEPYIKIPVSGVGIGRLPITSSGVYVGFTKNLF